MISCDNESSCPNGEWFHYKCVGILNRVVALKYTTGKKVGIVLRIVNLWLYKPNNLKTEKWKEKKTKKSLVVE